MDGTDLIKFFYIFLCFITALVSYRGCFNIRDWQYLVVGMGFTVAADFFMVLMNNDFIGLFFFIFVHAAYIVRAGVGRRKVIMVLSGALVLALVLPFDTLPLLALVYACFFVWDIYINIKTARFLIITGLLLFALCDINVLIYSLPAYFPGTAGAARIAYKLIWWFYAPAQGLLAVSALRFNGKKCYN